MLVAAFKLGPKRTRTLNWTLFAISLILSIIMLGKHPKRTFYLIHTRALELLTGSIIALGFVPAATSQLQREIGATVGLFAILAAIVGYQFAYAVSWFRRVASLLRRRAYHMGR
jgi:hypothetical protein